MDELWTTDDIKLEKEKSQDFEASMKRTLVHHNCS